MGDQPCDAVSYDGFGCDLNMGHITVHRGDDVLWAEGWNEPTLCRVVTDEPGPLPSMCDLSRGHVGVHISSEHKRVLHAWEG